ncbi:MAG: hypothetical protein HYS39_01350, partial [Proteobacteria bacterium]|nr:hypothetical protein [Pseudomonadota bacterium]
MTTSQQKFLWQLLILSFIISIGFAFYYHYTELSPFEPDSHGYIAFASSRTVGYPLFLKLFHGIFNSFIPILYIQQTLYAISTVCLCMAFYRLTENKKLCFLLFFLLSCNRWMIKYNFLILTESLSFSFVMIILSVMVFYLFSPKRSYLILLSSLVGLAILIRPVFYAFIPVLFLLSFYIRSYHPVLKSLVSFLIPLVFILNSSSVYNWFQHGFYNTESFLGHNLIGKVGFIVDRSIPSHHPTIIQAYSDVAEPIQELDHQITSSHLRYLIRAPYYDYFRYNRLNDIVNTSTLSPSKADELYKEVAFDIIKAKPFEYLYDV